MPRLLLPAISSALLLGAHQFHFGHLDANWNSHSRALELTVRLHADDLEALLRQQQGRGLELDRDPQAERLACAYVLRTVAFDDIRFRCIGMKVSTHFATLFLEGPAATPPRRARFQSLSAAFPDQVNTLQMQHDGKALGPAVPFLPANIWKPLPAKKRPRPRPRSPSRTPRLRLRPLPLYRPGRLDPFRDSIPRSPAAFPDQLNTLQMQPSTPGNPSRLKSGLELDRDPQEERLASTYVRFRCIGLDLSTHFATPFLEAPPRSPTNSTPSKCSRQHLEPPPG